MEPYKFGPEPAGVLLAAFDEENGASQALEHLKALHKEEKLVLKDAAVLRRDEENKLHIKETADMSGKKGAVIGAIAGGVLSLLAGPLVLVGAAGALIGGLGAHLSDSGISNDRLAEMGKMVRASDSVLVVTMPLDYLEAVRKELLAQGADAISTELTARAVAEMEAKLQEQQEGEGNEPS